MRRFGLILGATLLSGALFAIATPPGDIQALGWVCFVPLLASLAGARLIAAILAPMGALMFGAWLTTTGWLYSWPVLEGEAAWHYSGFLLFALALTPAFLAAACQTKPSGWTVFALAAAFTACESLLLLYLPGHIALSQYRSPAMLFVASLGGIWLVSLLVWWVQLRMAFWLAEKTWPSRPALAALALPVTVAAVWEHRDPGGPNTPVPPEPQGLRVGIIQSIDSDFEDLSKWTQEAKALGAKLVVWPELSAAGIAAGGRTERLLELSVSLGDTGFVTTFPNQSDPKPYNTAAVFEAGRESPHYYKRKPFAAEAKDHQAGTRAVAVEAAGARVGLNVCFDSCYPNISREPPHHERADVVALPCMGPESPYGVIQSIHGAFTPFRSAEAGVPIVRGETSAFAMVTDSSGRVVAQAPPGFQGLVMADIEAKRRWTLASQLGDGVLWMCWAIALGTLGKASAAKISRHFSGQDRRTMDLGG